MTIEVDLAPDESHEQLALKLDLWITDNPRKSPAGFVDGLAPQRLSAHIIQHAIPQHPNTPIPSQKQRNKLIETLKAWPLGKVKTVPIEKGEVVAGGVALDEVDPHSMRSTKCHGLYLCGEILDVAGPVGGYNLRPLSRPDS